MTVMSWMRSTRSLGSSEISKRRLSSLRSSGEFSINLDMPYVTKFTLVGMFVIGFATTYGFPYRFA